MRYLHLPDNPHTWLLLLLVLLTGELTYAQGTKDSTRHKDTVFPAVHWANGTTTNYKAMIRGKWQSFDIMCDAVDEIEAVRIHGETMYYIGASDEVYAGGEVRIYYSKKFFFSRTKRLTTDEP